ncbi:hypothetical protein A33M_0166 [Rhodovulum sp. PH10]|uniref:hypothetical protein n=1 Tax=Rhodovulum sp. PH10 TaxID=1187851 RepID=UPI00027C208E|nr:hypothetical protein [Rhodovulum sp. PH10]EJW10379.1 hypothetical protein A33M_0166 [Rhodovulum sp. PH10]
MTEPAFDPPLALRDEPVPLRTLDEAAGWLRLHGPGHGHNWEGVLRRLQSASSTAECRDAAAAFRGWLDATGLLVGFAPPDETRAPGTVAGRRD